jgi:hypothetical protein
MPSPNWREKVKAYRFAYLSDRLMQKAAEEVKAREEVERGHPLRLSASGACARKLAYQRFNWEARRAGKPEPFPEESLNPRALLVFHLGDMVEASLKAWIVKTEILYGQPGARVTLRIVVDGHTYEIHGHLDGMIQEPGQEMTLCVLEIKSINPRGFDRLDTEGPDYAYLCQVTGYMRSLGLTRARILYENKATSHLDEWVVEYSPELMQEIEERFASVIRATPENLPDREYQPEVETEWVRGTKGLIGLKAENMDSTGHRITERKQNGYWRETGRLILGYPCSYCSQKGSCWPTAKLEAEDGTPTWIVPPRENA